MNREIYTYTNLEQIANSESFQEIKQFPQFVVSSDLRKSLVGDIDKEHVRGVFSGDSVVKVEEFRNILFSLDPYWATDAAKFEQTVTLSEFFRKIIHERGDDFNTRKWLVGCRRNTSQVLSAINLLEEAGVTPEDINFAEDRNIDLLVEAWNYLIDHNGTIKRFRENMNKLNSKETWNRVFLERFHSSDIYTVVMHGFYYITPIQQRVIDSLEKIGIKTIYLFQYDERYPYVNEIWRKTYSEKNGYPKYEDWHKDTSRVVDPFGSLFEGEIVKNTNKITIREYSSVMEFVNDIKSEKNNKVSIYSSNHLTANRILQHFFPDDYGDRKLLSYPIGQFVATLNSLWDEEKEDVILDENSIIECFASGWLAKDGISGKECMQDLMSILPFFKNTETLDEWNEKINKLKEIKTGVVNKFDEELDADDRIARWQHIAGNPFTNFGVFNVSFDKLDVVLSLIEQLINMARDLFTKSTEINIGVHIQKLENTLYEHEMSDKLFTEELEIVKELFAKLDEPEGFSSKCFPGDIATALNVFLSGRFDDNELQPNKVGLVYPMFQVDSSSIKSNGKVHICLCDVDSMPGGNKRYIWPLTGRVIKKCLSDGIKAGKENKLLNNLIGIMEDNAISNRYFMYCALKNKEVTISWVSDLNDKLLAPSPYIGLVKEAFDLQVKNYNRYYIPYDRVKNTDYGNLRLAPYDNKRRPDNILKEARMDYALCSLRYIFGYVVEKNPSFRGEFQQNYAITSLVKAIYYLMMDEGMTVTDIYNNVIGMFPGLRKVEKRQIKDYLNYFDARKDADYLGQTPCGDRLYTDARILIHFPNDKVRTVAYKKYRQLDTPDGKKGLSLDEQIDMIDVCTFCPHQSFCRKAKYTIDINADEEEKYYD